MSPPENKNESKTPSSMNIKTAFLAAANRKRKSSTSPNIPKKNLKVSDVKIIKEAAAVKADDDIEILFCDNDIAVGESKENTDLNVCKSDLNASLTTEKKVSPQKSVPVKSQSASNSDLSDSDLSPESSDESNVNESLNSSNVNESLNSSYANESLNSSNVNESFNASVDQNEKDEQNETEASPVAKKRQITEQSTPKGSSDLCHKDAPSKRKKKMSAETAKQKSEEREQNRKQTLEKKQALNAEKLKRRLENEQRKIQKERERERKEIEKKERERLKQEKKEQEEMERQQKLKEREDQKKIKQLQLELKLEEKKRKEEQRLKREEEIKKAEEEKLEKKLEKEQKEKEKRERNKAAFMKFFVAPSKSSTAPAAPQVVKQELAFKPFQVKEGMTLAPVVSLAAKQRFNKEKLDTEFNLQNCADLYLQVLKSSTYKDIRLRKKLRKLRTCDDVIVLDNSDPELHLKAKLLQFTENVRPPYWGTWRKKSAKIRARNPFGEDEIFDYSVDSDDEWDEGGPGESLSGTENEVESEDDYEVDNEFFVPHGYLSAEEEEMDDEVEDGVETDPKKKEAKLTLKQQEFDLERKKKTTELKPMILGCHFENSEEPTDSGLHALLQTYAGELMCEMPILTRFTVKKFQSESKSQSSATTSVDVFPEEAMPHLIRLVHGNLNKRSRLCNEFMAFWHLHAAPSSKDPKTEEGQDPNPHTPTSSSRSMSKRQFNRLLKTIATYGKIANPAVRKCCWYVQDEVRAKYGLQDAPIPNQWTYLSVEKETEVTASPVVSKSTSGSIKGFLKP